MFTFTNDAEKAHLFIQLKGENAGRPLKEKIPNSIGILVDSRYVLPEYLYYVILHLFQGGWFRGRIKGSVIPYITQPDFEDVVFNFFIEGGVLC